MNDPSIEREELERRVLLAALSLGVRLCCRLGVPLKELTQHARVAYFRELRQQGLSIAQCAEQLEVSERTAKNLARELRESFELPDHKHTLPTRIEFMLWRSPMSLARLHQVLKEHEHREVDEAVALLLKQQRIRLDDEPSTPVYVPTQSVNSQLSPDWIKRIGGLNSLMDNLYQVIGRRFFDEEPCGDEDEQPQAYARTLSFYVEPGRLSALKRLFWEVVVPQIAALDQESHLKPGALPVKLTMFWASQEEEAPEEKGP